MLEILYLNDDGIDDSKVPVESYFLLITYWVVAFIVIVVFMVL